MKKLQLDPDDLLVQSFATEAAGTGGGTVFARATEFWVQTCGGNPDSCNATYCGDCPDTNPGGGCGGDATGDCVSVNIAGCQSAYYTECCGGGDGTMSMCRYSADTYNTPGIGCT